MWVFASKTLWPCCSFGRMGLKGVQTIQVKNRFLEQLPEHMNSFELMYFVWIFLDSFMIHTGRYLSPYDPAVHVMVHSGSCVGGQRWVQRNLHTGYWHLAEWRPQFLSTRYVMIQISLVGMLLSKRNRWKTLKPKCCQWSWQADELLKASKQPQIGTVSRRISHPFNVEERKDTWW